MDTLTSTFTNLLTLLETYKIQAKTEGIKHTTLNIYTTAITVLYRFLKMDGLPTDVTQIGRQEIKRFVLNLQSTKAYSEHPYTKQQQKGLSSHTINAYLRAIRAFWGWLWREEIIDENPFDKIKVPKPTKKIILAFTDDQIKNLLAAINTVSTTGFRNYTVINTLLDTGLRITELCGIKMNDLNLSQRSIKVTGKMSKQRVVPFGATVQKLLAKYMGKFRSTFAIGTSPFVFITREGEPLTANRVETFMKDYGIEARIEGVRCSPHTLRHTFAISYLRNGGDVFTLQRILGHETLDMVRNYVNVAQYDLEAVHLKCSPVDHLKLKTGRTNQNYRRDENSNTAGTVEVARTTTTTPNSFHGKARKNRVVDIPTRDGGS